VNELKVFHQFGNVSAVIGYCEVAPGMNEP
jgi:hypothetical protein